MAWWRLGLLLATAWAAGAWLLAARDEPPRLRRPVAAVLLDDGRTLGVANARTGTVTLVDLGRGEVRDEIAVGRSLSDLVALPGGKRLLAVDGQAHELIGLKYDGLHLTVQSRQRVSPYPASVAVDGQRATVASLWSRRMTGFDLNADGRLPVRWTIALPFAPRLQCPLPGGRLLVADAFGGHLALIDSAHGKLIAVHEIEGHNLRGLALRPGGKEVLVAHQILNQHAATTRENLQTGVLMKNFVRVLDVEQLAAQARVLPLGEPGAGAADPSGLALVEDGTTLVALAGVNEVAVLRADGTTARRLPVGRRPTVLLCDTQRQVLAVLNTLDDSVSLLDAEASAVTKTIPLGPPAVLEPHDRGELLFFSGRLARDGWMSCHSCHPDGHSNGLLADTLGDGSFGTPKRTLTLLNTALTDPWAWNGEMKYLHDQVHKSLDETMHAPEVRQQDVTDLASFLHTLPPPPPLEPTMADRADREQVERGRQIFHDRGCVNCHIPPLVYTSHGAEDGGFADERGRRKFNPPSLRGVGQGYYFLHDNRAATLEEVFAKYRHKVGAGLADDERADLLRFLRSL